ncbi:MAG: ABC transporter ATP-binding protein [Spirochaetales bacterium]|nr:ABC transporter ATP-binding protein [Spirochaetales bacterium]
MKSISSFSFVKYIGMIPLRYALVFIANGILILGIHAMGYLSPLFQKQMIDSAMANGQLFNSFFFYMIITYVAFFVLSIAARAVGIRNTISISRTLFFRVWEKLVFMKKGLITDKGTGYYFNILSDDVNNMTNLFNEAAFFFLFSVVQSVMILLLVFTWSKILFVGLVVIYCVTLFLSIAVTRWKKKYLTLLRESSGVLAAETLDSIRNAFTIKTYLRIEKIKNDLSSQFFLANKFVRKTVDINNIGSLAISAAETMGFLFLIVYSVFLIINKELSYGSLLALISYFKILFNPVENFFNLISTLTSAEISGKRLDSVCLDSECKDIELKQKYSFFGEFEKLEFDNVHFCYDTNANRNKKNKISLELRSNEILGLVGLSGEGKSTILKMLYKELLPSDGSIKINGRTISELPDLLYFYHVNILTQDNEIFNKDLIFNLTCGKQVVAYENSCSIKTDIRQELSLFFEEISTIERQYNGYGKSDSKINRAIIKCMNSFHQFNELFCLLGILGNGAGNFEYRNTILYNFKQREESFLDNLGDIHFNCHYIVKERLNEVISKLELDKLRNRVLGENGSFLSGGEKRRIMIGRFLLREGYGFFIIDEAFSSLDIINEMKLLDLLKDELRNKSGIVISHKFNVLLQLTNRSLVLDKGSPVQQGLHHELVKTKGIYQDLYNNYLAQSKNREKN